VAKASPIHLYQTYFTTATLMLCVCFNKVEIVSHFLQVAQR